jgi:CBS domain-containing protein
MLIQEYISKDFPAFEIDAPVEEALLQVEEFGFTHIFVKKKNVFLGGICKEFLEENPDKTLEALEMHLERFAIMEENTILDSIKLFYTFNSNIIPVLSNKEKYLGYIAYDDVFGDLSKYPLFSERGAVLTVETSIKSYSMTEIAKIVEGNNAKFYGSFISHINDEIVQVTMRIIIATQPGKSQVFKQNSPLKLRTTITLLVCSVIAVVLFVVHSVYL